MPGPFRREEPLEAISDINVVPLADVSLVLLIILLVLSPMMAQSLLHVKTAGRQDPEKSMEPPPTAAPAPEFQEATLVVDLGPKGLALGDRFFSRPTEFITVMRFELAGRRDKKVFLAPHPDTAYGLVVHWLETIKDLGAESVALVQTVEEAAPAP